MNIRSPSQNSSHKKNSPLETIYNILIKHSREKIGTSIYT